MGLVNPVHLRDYRKYLFDFDFENACKLLEKIIVQQRISPSNEAEFAAFALYSLMTIERSPDCLDIAFEHGMKLEEEDRSRGKYPTFDGAVLLNHQGSFVLLVIELKFEAKGGDIKIKQKNYIRRARSLFEKRNPGISIEREIAVSMNLVISPEIKVILEQ